MPKTSGKENSTSAICDAVINLFELGTQPSQIQKALGTPKSTYYNILGCHSERGHKDIPRSGQPYKIN